MLHHKFDEVLTLVQASIPVLLTGSKGTGKTTLAMQVAEHLKYTFFSMSMTRQTTLSHLLGFINVNGKYIPSQLYKAVTEGGVFLLDEIDAGDANVLLCLNTIENGYVAFPEGIVNLHKNFRLLASSNPKNAHDSYVGRNKLDAATLDRFDIIDINRDDDLEKSLVDEDVYGHISTLRKILKESNSSIDVSMRDAMRYQNRKTLDLLEGYVFRLLGENQLLYDNYLSSIPKTAKHTKQEECNTVEDLWDLMTLKVPPPKKADIPFY